MYAIVHASSPSEDRLASKMCFASLRKCLTRRTSCSRTPRHYELLEPRRIQGFETTGLAAIFDSVAHFKGHTQEIVHLTRMQLGDRYRFEWVPSTPEEGATGA